MGIGVKVASGISADVVFQDVGLLTSRLSGLRGY
jgi:hypothetical protein